MDSRVRQQIARAQSAPDDPADAGWLAALGELVFALPVRMARGVAAAFRPELSQPGHTGIDVPRMSSEWLQQISAESEKRGQAP